MSGYYDPWTVFCSFLIACLAGFVAFESVDHTRYSKAVRGWVFWRCHSRSRHLVDALHGNAGMASSFCSVLFGGQNTFVSLGCHMRILAGSSVGGTESL